jgi:hypothetical protein
MPMIDVYATAGTFTHKHQLRGHGSFADAYRNGIFVTVGLTAAALLLALIDHHRGRRARDETV